MSPRLFPVLAALALSTAAVAAPQGTTFTYQGELTVSGERADGIFDIEFGLFSAASGDVPLATHVGHDLEVSDGLFTVDVDFTDAPFIAGDQYWIELRVRPGDATGGFQQLLPRQKLTSAPYAIAARYVGEGGVGPAALAPGAIASSTPITGDGRSGSPLGIASGSILGTHIASNTVGAAQLFAEAGMDSQRATHNLRPVTEPVQSFAEVTLDIPSNGYVFLHGYVVAHFNRSGVIGAQNLLVGVWDGPGGAGAGSVFRVTGPGVEVATVHASNMLPVSPGVRTFYINAQDTFGGSGATGGISISSARISALFFPTRY